MNDNMNEVEVIEQDLLMTVDDFAKQECVTTRTVYRWIEQGRLDVIERLGKKYVNASVPLKTPMTDNDTSGHDVKSGKVGALQSVNIFEEYMKTVRENGKHYEKSCRRWQIGCFVSSFLLIMALLACTALSLIYHYGTKGMSDKMETSSAEIARVEDEKQEVLAQIEDLNAKISQKVKPYIEENQRLRERLDKVVAQNDGLRDRLDKTFERNAVLLQRFAELESIDEVAMADSSGKSSEDATR